MLAFLHTAHAHAASFERLVREIDAQIPMRHRVEEGLLGEAVSAGTITNAVRARLADALGELAHSGASLIVCTCSTLAAAAEAVPLANCSVMRIDRPMAEQAVASGRRILVLAALRSTLEPTVALLQQVAASTQRSPTIVEVLNESAWQLFAAGEQRAYAEAIALTIENSALPADVVLLAQASMAPASELVRDLGIAVLSSPRSGVLAAVSAYRRLAVAS